MQSLQRCLLATTADLRADPIGHCHDEAGVAVLQVCPCVFAEQLLRPCTDGLQQPIASFPLPHYQRLPHQ
jgi:hypothetical protein